MDLPVTTHAMIQSPEKLLPERIDPVELGPGDYLRDLGRYRRVTSVAMSQDPVRSVARYFVHFADDLEMDLGIPWNVEVTVWREP